MKQGEIAGPHSGAGAGGAGPRGAIAIFGATSGIARAAAEAWLARGEDLVLIGRSTEALEALAKDLEVARPAGGTPLPIFAWDIADFAGHRARFAELTAAHRIKGLFLAAGVLHSPDDCAADPSRTVEIFQVNLTGPAVIADLFAAHLQAGDGGFLSVLTSVAGDRGRPSNYHYGASKAGLSVFLEGLRGRLFGRGAPVLVQDVRPGPVRTRMTAHMRSSLMADPSTAARDILRAVDRGREVVYTPGYWRVIMAVIRAIPAPIFKRLRL